MNRKEVIQMTSFQGHMTLEIDDKGKEKVFADFNSPQGTRIKRVEIQTKKVQEDKPDTEPKAEKTKPEEKKPAADAAISPTK